MDTLYSIFYTKKDVNDNLKSYNEILTSTGAFVGSYQFRHNRDNYVTTISFPDIQGVVGSQDVIHISPMNFRYRPLQTYKFPVITLNNTNTNNIGVCTINSTGTIDFSFSTTGTSFTTGTAGIYSTSFTYDISGPSFNIN